MTQQPPTPRDTTAPDPPSSAHTRERTPRVHVDLDLCIGSGICAATAPRHFTTGPHGQAHPRPDAPPPDGYARDAAALCPAEAILIATDAGPPPDPPPLRQPSGPSSIRSGPIGPCPMCCDAEAS